MTTNRHNPLRFVMYSVAVVVFAFALLCITVDSVADSSDAATIYYNGSYNNNPARLIEDDTTDRSYITLSNVSSSQPFLGWSEQQNASSPSYYYGQVISLTQQTYDLYPIFTSGNKIIFDPNGGSVTSVTGNTSSSSNYAPSGSSQVTVPWIQFTVDSTTYTYSRPGHTFLGWSTNKYATVAEYTYGDVLERTSRDTGYVLYAIWQSDSNIIFDANGPYVTPGNYTQSCESPVYVPGSTFTADGDTYTWTYELAQ